MLRNLLLAGLLLTFVGIAGAPAEASSVGFCAAGVCQGVSQPTPVSVTCTSVASPAVLFAPSGYVVVVVCV